MCNRQRPREKRAVLHPLRSLRVPEAKMPWLLKQGYFLNEKAVEGVLE